MIDEIDCRPLILSALNDGRPMDLQFKAGSVSGKVGPSIFLHGRDADGGDYARITFSGGGASVTMMFGNDIQVTCDGAASVSAAAAEFLLAVEMLAKMQGFEVRWPGKPA